MKMLLLLLFPFLIAQAYGSVYITDVKILPADPKINDILVIEANIINNSYETISYPSLCASPLDVEFDDNIAKEYGVGCLGFAIERLEPFNNATVRAPPSGIFYKVIDEGLTRTNITFTYLDSGNNISKEVIFSIGESDRVEDRFDMKINQTVLFNDLEITLFAIDDFRCPIDVRCVWEGDARLSLAIEKNSFIDNFDVSLYKPLLIDNLVIELVSLEPVRKQQDNIDVDEYKAIFTISEPKASIKFRSYNDKYGIIGALNLENYEGVVILFKDGKREILQFIAEDVCNRLNSMACINANNIHIEIGRDFILLNKQYIPIINIKVI